jgi:hypothetical protein
LYTFRNPRKLMFILSLAVSVLFGIAVSRWFFRAREHGKKKFIALAFMGIIVSLLLTYSWPIFTYDLGMTQARPTFPDAYKVPERYFAIAEEVKSNLPYKDSRTIWLPLNLITQYGVTGLDLNVYLLPSGGVLRGSDPFYYLSLYKVLLNEKTNEWGKWLSAANVRYVIVDKLAEQEGKPSLVYKWDTAFPSGDPKMYYDLLRRQSDLRVVVDKAEYAIFENTRTTSSINVYDISAYESIKSADPETAYQYSTMVNSLKLIKKSVTEYSIQGTTTKDLVVVMNTKYDPMWTSNDPMIGDHFKAFNFSNGFILKAGTINGSVYYSYEQVYFVTSGIAYSAWAAGLVIILNPRMIPRIIKRISRR